jgi:hypothetical protein
MLWLLKGVWRKDLDDVFNGSYFGVDLILYLVLICLAFWRHICPWRPKRKWLEYFNYCNILYALLLGLLVSLLDSLVRAIVKEFRAPQKTNIPMLVILVAVPLANIVTMVLSLRQTRAHINAMREDDAIIPYHDRALQIIALPPVYGLMAMCALMKLYHQVTNDLAGEAQGIVIARYETCIFVGDLYEAWALYQFGTLTFELLDATFTERQLLMSPPGRTPTSRSRDVTLTFKAVSSLAWLGTWLFVVICILQAGWSEWLWTFHDPAEDWTKYGAELKKFSYAGLIASGAAVYNVHTIESTFGHLIDGYSPLLKFLSVKLLVFFAFWQLKVLLVLKSLTILQLPELQIKMLHAALLVFECFGSAVLHVKAWNATEVWYKADNDTEHAKATEEGAHDEKAILDERRPLLHKRSM